MIARFARRKTLDTLRRPCVRLASSHTVTEHLAKEIPSITVYLDLKSPHAYLAVLPTLEVERDYHCRVDWMPFELSYVDLGVTTSASDMKDRVRRPPSAVRTANTPNVSRFYVPSHALCTLTHARACWSLTHITNASTHGCCRLAIEELGCIMQLHGSMPSFRYWSRCK